MANSKFEYVKKFELDDSLLPDCWIVVRLDGKGFTKFTAEHGFEKPNDARGLGLMNAAAQGVMMDFPDIIIGFGESDEYSFVLHKDTALYGRRCSKLVSLITSSFTGHYVNKWGDYLKGVEMKRVPLFDCRSVLYPNVKCLRDYLAWRQADTHINCQYNTCYWLLVKEGMEPLEAQETLKGTLTADKNELMFQRGLNYNDLPELYRKGTVIFWEKELSSRVRATGKQVEKIVRVPKLHHIDIIRDAFWEEHPEILDT